MPLQESQNFQLIKGKKWIFQLTAYVGSMKGSLTATMLISSCSMAFRKTIRPMRPKPLMPTFTGAMILKRSEYMVYL
jgi:hypothetical protein